MPGFLFAYTMPGFLLAYFLVFKGVYKYTYNVRHFDGKENPVVSA